MVDRWFRHPRAQDFSVRLLTTPPLFSLHIIIAMCCRSGHTASTVRSRTIVHGFFRRHVSVNITILLGAKAGGFGAPSALDLSVDYYPSTVHF